MISVTPFGECGLKSVNINLNYDGETSLPSGSVG